VGLDPANREVIEAQCYHYWSDNLVSGETDVLLHSDGGAVSYQIPKDEFLADGKGCL
jgi:hypothetical protein